MVEFTDPKGRGQGGHHGNEHRGEGEEKDRKQAQREKEKGRVRKEPLTTRLPGQETKRLCSQNGCYTGIKLGEGKQSPDP